MIPITSDADCFSEVCNASSESDCSRRGRLLHPVETNVTSHSASSYQSDAFSTDTAASVLCYDDLLFSTFGIQLDRLTGTKCGQLNRAGDILDCCYFCHQQMENILLSRLIETLSTTKGSRNFTEETEGEVEELLLY